VEQPAGTNILAGGTKDLKSVVEGNAVDLTFTIRNTGTADLTGLAASIDANAGVFSVTAQPTTSPVSGPAGTTTFIVHFAPTSTGPKTASLHLARNDATNTFNIPLTGTDAAPHVIVEQPAGTNILAGGT